MTAPAALVPETADAIRRAMALAHSGDLRGAAAEGERAIAAGADEIPLSAMVGMLKARAGDAAGAVPFLRIAHEGRPDDLTIATNLVTTLMESDDKAGAYAACPAELAERDASGTLLRLHAHLAQATEDYPAAIAAYRTIVAREPCDWESLNNLGNALAGMDNLDASIAALTHALTLNPDSAPTRLNLALQLNLAGKVDEGEALLRDAIRRDPLDLPALSELGALLRLKGPSDEVADLFGRAGAIDPTDVALAVAHGSEARDMNRFNESEMAYRRALMLEPANPFANLGLANFFENLNREDELPNLIASARMAGAEPGVLAYIDALDCRRSGKFGEGLKSLDQISDAVERPRCEHLRGQFLDGLGRYDAAFDAFTEMNELFRADPSQPEARAAVYADIVRSDFATVTPSWFKQWGPPAEPDSRSSPVFLVGFPRSGTTLLDTILMSHPDVEILEEEPTLREVSEILHEVGALPDATAEILMSARDKYWEVAEKLTALRPGSLLVDKNPLLMNKLPLIRRLFPDARIILAVRHPCDVVLSCYITNFSLNAGMANFLTLESTANLYDLSFRFAERAIEVMSLSVHTVIYENIVADRELELRALFEFLGLDWDPAVLDHQSTARGREHIKTASYAQVVQPIYTRAAGRWERYRKHLAPILPILQPWIERFGYTA
jgi:tetratricopeptide (TPR) repeat protein